MSVFKRVCLVGFDRIIGSLALGLRRAGYRGAIIGVADPYIIDRCWKLGLISDGSQKLEEAVVGADLIMVSSRTGHGGRVLPVVLEAADENATISEMTRVKRDVNRVFEESARSDVHYVGFRLLGDIEDEEDYAKADKFFFERKTVILTPRGKQDLDAFSKMQAAMRGMGADVVAMSPQAHDRILAQVAQVPKAAIVAILQRIFEGGEDIKITPEMLGKWLVQEVRDLAHAQQAGWADDVTANADLVKDGIDDLIARLQKIKGEIATGTLGATVKDVLNRSGEVIVQAQKASIPELVLNAGGDLKIVEKASEILAKARIPIGELQKLERGEPGSFRITVNTDEDRDRAVNLLRSAGIEAATL